MLSGQIWLGTLLNKTILVLALLLYAAPSSAAIARVANATGAGANTFTTSSINSSTANFIACGLSENGSGSVTLSDSNTNTWNKLTEQTGTPAVVIYYATNPTVGAGHTFTATGSSIFSVLNCTAYSGAATTTPFDIESGTFGGAFINTAQPGSVTPGANNELVYTAFGWSASMTMTSVTGFNIINQTDFTGGVNYGGGTADQIQTTATAVNATWNFSGTVGGSVVQAVFKVGGAGAPATPQRLTLMGVGP